MPTMASIDVESNLRYKLESLRSSKHGTSCLQSNMENILSLSDHDFNRPNKHTNVLENINNNKESMKVPPINTPLSLLSRDPNTTSHALSIPISQLYDLRAAVSDAIVMDGGGIGHGIESCRIIASAGLVSHRDTIKQKQQFPRTVDVRCEEHLSRPPKLLRPPPIVVGAVTALDLCLESSSICQLVLSTGSRAVDKLIAPSSPKLILGEQSCHITPCDMVVPSPSKRRKSHKDWNDDRNESEPSSAEEANLFVDEGNSSETREHYHQYGDSNKSLAEPSPSSLPTAEPGVYPGTITQVNGPPGSGKTQLALSLAVNAVLPCTTTNNRNKWKVHYLTAGGGSTTLSSLARRIRKLCLSHKLVNSSGTNDLKSKQEMIENTMEKINFIPVGNNGYALLGALGEIEDDLLNNRHGAVGESTLFIIDSISGCLSLNLHGNGDGGAGAALVNEISLTLRRLSRMIYGGCCVGSVAGSTDTSATTDVNHSEMLQMCAVFVINGTVSSIPGGLGAGGGNSGDSVNNKFHKAALGEIWRAPDVCLNLDIVTDDYQHCDKYTNPNHDGQENLKRSLRALYTSNVSTPKPTKKIPGLDLSSVRWIRATLEKHYANSCRCRKVNHLSAFFGITPSGIVDTL